MSRGYSQSHTCNFSPLFPFCETGPPPSSTELRSALTMWPHGNEVKTVGWYVTHPSSIRYLSLPLPYSRHLVSTFKNLTTTTTHCHLSHFHYTNGASTININIINKPTHQPYDSNISKQTIPISRE
jgi:hypothetical protein